MTPSTEPFCGMSLLVSACHREMLVVTRQFYDGMQACVRLDDGECSDKFDVGQVLRQGIRCVHAPLLFNMLFTAVLRVAEKRFLADAAITDNMVQL